MPSEATKERSSTPSTTDLRRVGIVTPGFRGPEDDWFLPFLGNYVEHLSAQIEVVVLALRYPLRRIDYRLNGARVCALGGAEVRGLRRLGLMRRSQSLLRALHREAPFDLLHAFWAHEPGWAATRFARRRRLPVVVSVLGGELVGLPEVPYGGQLETVNRWLVDRSLAAADLVICGSDQVADQARGRVPDGGLRLQSLGVDTDRFRPEGPAAELAGAPSLLCVASWIPVKDHETLLRAFRQVHRQIGAARLHLVGGGRLADGLARLAADLGIADALHMHGEVAHERLPEFYRGCDFCVLTSRSEHNALCVLEAAACGRLTVGTPVGKLPELVSTERLAAVGDVTAVARVMVETWQAGDGYRREAEGLSRRVRSEFDVATCVASHLELYREVLEEPAR